MDFTSELNSLGIEIDHGFKQIFLNKNSFQSRVFEAIDYSLFTGGKRLRPIITLKSCELFNGGYMDAMPYAMGIEMIHTYSLIHDDLPAMDDDDLRRGKPTNHKVFGEAMAILSGDGLLNHAFETIIKNIVESSDTIDDYKRKTRALEEISKYSGVYGMIGGQVVDLFSSHDSMTEEKLLFMYKTKTAALIQASLVAGAIIGGANDIEIETMREFGLNLGLAYQIRDDILDMEEDNSIKKLTYLTFHDIEKAKNDLVEYSSKAIDKLKSLNGRDIDFFVWLTEKLIKRHS
ncbi:polyprenyl synthetase family protein [Tissierella sp.]|uniref:polyprenyl synthetase family protein n=1 Tax=Tissierella sp. TaxID=41274 RepID=UPI00285E53A4|nr:polyprenyl synthetase family protein [Tissierella sp.]MDR7856151.1 polyprenyl synthetase family protein [Tissierella sp.]